MKGGREGGGRTDGLETAMFLTERIHEVVQLKSVNCYH